MQDIDKSFSDVNVGANPCAQACILSGARAEWGWGRCAGDFATQLPDLLTESDRTQANTKNTHHIPLLFKGAVCRTTSAVSLTVPAWGAKCSCESWLWCSDQRKMLQAAAVIGGSSLSSLSRCIEPCSTSPTSNTSNDSPWSVHTPHSFN